MRSDDDAMSWKTEPKLKAITFRGYGSTDDDAVETVVKVADRKYRIFDVAKVRKARGENGVWLVTVRVYDE